MSCELQQLQMKDKPENTYSEAHDVHTQSLRKGESPAWHMEIMQGSERRITTNYWTRFLGVMIIVNLLFTIICIAIFIELRSEVMLLKKEKTSQSPMLKAEALTDEEYSVINSKPILATSVAEIKCEKGDRGLKGEAGNGGRPGSTGPKGQKGDCGINGINGTKGDTGKAGMPGASGIRGPQGIGIPGEQGPPGYPGPEGPQGDRGPRGYNGSDGMNGEVGPQGLPGQRGSKGERGEVGALGEPGSPGLRGIGGTKGNMGETGPSGLNGRNGADGLKGEKGDSGQRGNTGLSGRDGANGTVGEPGIKGEKGEPGEIPDIATLRATVQTLQRQIRANRNIRLVGSGSTLGSGRVEIYHSGEWGTICDDSWDTNDGTVVCKMLGFAGAVMVRGSAAYGQGNGRIWLDEVRCSGSETDISQCTKNSWGENDCSHGEDASVVCQN